MTKRITKISIYFILMFLPFIGETQTTNPRDYVNNKMFWTETIINGKIKNKWRYQLDYQYRRQAYSEDFADKNHMNPFQNNFQQVIRPWIHYQASPNVRLSLSPLGWWGTWNPSTSATGAHTYQPEFRICPQVTLIQKIGRIEFSQRYRMEYRIIGTKVSYSDGDKAGAFTDGYTFPDANRKLRFRYFVRAIIPLTHKEMSANTLYTNIFNEVFISGGKNVGNSNLLDQNRTFAGLGYRFKKPVRIELGCLLQEAFRFNNAKKNNVEQNGILQVFLIFDSLKELFKKSETQKNP